MSARREKLFRMKANAPTYRILRRNRPMTLSSPPIAQNSPASVMSMPISVAVRNPTSGPSSPNPLSM
jgi:hypothetical protein